MDPNQPFLLMSKTYMCSYGDFGWKIVAYVGNEIVHTSVCMCNTITFLFGHVTRGGNTEDKPAGRSPIFYRSTVCAYLICHENYWEAVMYLNTKLSKLHFTVPRTTTTSHGCQLGLLFRSNEIIPLIIYFFC